MKYKILKTQTLKYKNYFLIEGIFKFLICGFYFMFTCVHLVSLDGLFEYNLWFNDYRMGG